MTELKRGNGWFQCSFQKETMKEKLFKRVIALGLAFSMGILWPGEAYQALAKDIGQQTDSSIESVPALSQGLNSGALSLPDVSQTELNSLRSTLLNAPEALSLPKAALREKAVGKLEKKVTPSSALDLPARQQSELLSSSTPLGPENGARAKNSILGRLSSRVFGSKQGVSSGLQAIRRLYDGENASSRALPSGEVVAGKISGSLRSRLRKASVAVGAAGVSAAVALPAYAEALHSAPATHGSLAFLAAAWPLFARGAYWVSMALGFVMAIPELHDLIKKRSYNWRTYGVIAANLMVGLIVAPAQTAADKFLWGSECLSVSAVLAVGIMLAKFLPKEKTQPNVPSQEGSWIRRWLSELKTDRALQMTVALAPLLIAAGFGMYFGLGVFMPSLIASFSPVSLPLISAGIQILVQGFYLSLFVPDLMAIRRGEKPNSFAPSFVLIFCLIAACFVVWGGTQAWQNPAKHIDLILVAASNVLQFLFSFITYRALKRPDSSGKKEGPLAVNSPRRFSLVYA